MDRDGNGFLTSKSRGRQVWLQSQIVSSRDHMPGKPVWIKHAWRRGLVHRFTFRSFGHRIRKGTLEARAEEWCEWKGQNESDMCGEALYGCRLLSGSVMSSLQDMFQLRWRCPR